MRVVADVADHLDLERVLWIPARVPPHKERGAQSPAGVRLEMVREAVRADPRFEVCTLELERSGPSYTVDTARALHAMEPEAELYLIMGVDQYEQLSTWHRPEELLTLVRLAVMDRGGESARAAAPGVPGAVDDAVFVPVGRVDVSSTAVRATIREGRDATPWLQEGVAAIIRREGLYSA